LSGFPSPLVQRAAAHQLGSPRVDSPEPRGACSTRCSPRSRSRTFSSRSGTTDRMGRTPSTATLALSRGASVPLYIALAAVGFTPLRPTPGPATVRKLVEAARNRAARQHGRPTGTVQATAAVGRRARLPRPAPLVGASPRATAARATAARPPPPRQRRQAARHRRQGTPVPAAPSA